MKTLEILKHYKAKEIGACSSLYQYGEGNYPMQHTSFSVKVYDEAIAELKAKDERIRELEEAQLTRREWYQKGYNEAMKSKTTCYGCKTLPFVLTELAKKNGGKCGNCKRYVKDNYEAEPKENA